MFRFFLFWCLVPVFAALPVVGAAHGEQVSGSNASNEELMGYFSLIGDSLKTPFILQITLENCKELKSKHGQMLPLTAFKLKYINSQTSSWETINIKLGKGGKNCIHNIEFYNDVQEKYNMELWASWNRQKASAGTFKGRASIKVLPKP
jgi:hypothetical protein